MEFSLPDVEAKVLLVALLNASLKFFLFKNVVYSSVDLKYWSLNHLTPQVGQGFFFFFVQYLYW